MQTLQELKNGELKGSIKVYISEGLTEFPRELFDLKDTLEFLDLSGNKLSELPSDFGDFKNLKIAFFSNNNFTSLPTVLSNCPKLTMIGFRANKISVFTENALPLKTQWLILTDNLIEEIPKSIGDCTFLQKMAIAGNKIKTLPEEMSKCVNLELLRISANNLESLPIWLASLPKLSWLAFSGNPCTHQKEVSKPLQQIHWDTIETLEQLGEGASGVISKAIWNSSTPKEVAIKIFKGEVTSDGYPEDELNNSILSGSHANLIPIIGEISNHSESKNGLVMELISSDYKNLGNPPSYDTCTRDVFSEDLIFSIDQLINTSKGVASAAKHLHEQSLMHGDLYAHNTMINPVGNALLGDFGAATCYDKDSELAHLLERLDVRAFGCLLDDLLERVEEKHSDVYQELTILKEKCFDESVAKRPSFDFIYSQLERLK